MPGVAVKVTLLPRQKGFVGFEMVTETGWMEVTDTGYWMLDTGFWMVQVSEEVKVQETRSPLTGVKV